MTPAASVDRAALVRRALLEAVAHDGFHGASMATVAKRAGVATGTAYVHYASKDDLVLAVYREVKADLSAAAVAGIEASDPPEQRFRAMWRNIHQHLAADPDQALFLRQVEASPYARPAHAQAIDPGDPLLAAAVADDLLALVVDLPVEVLFDLGFGPAIRLVASGDAHLLDDAQLDRLAGACWRAITRPEPGGRRRR